MNGITRPSRGDAAAVLFLKDEAICLNVRPFSKTSHMVTWMTRRHGCLTTPIKGGQRPKSGFLGCYDVAYTCELVCYAHESNGVHHIRECVPTAFREALRDRWRAAAAADYACDLTMRTARQNLPNEALYGHLRELLDLLEHCPESFVALTLLWFESVLLRATGLMPDFTLCPACRDPTAADFSLEEGRFWCVHRPSRLARPESIRLHRDIPELFAFFLTHPLDAVVAEAKASGRTDDLGRPEPFPGIFGLRRFLGLFLCGHLDLLPGPRRTVLDLLLSGDAAGRR